RTDAPVRRRCGGLSASRAAGYRSRTDGHGERRAGREPLRCCTWIRARAHHSSGRDRCLHDETVCTWDQCNEPFFTVSYYTRRFFGGRHPLCGIGVTSVMLAIL